MLKKIKKLDVDKKLFIATTLLAFLDLGICAFELSRTSEPVQVVGVIEEATALDGCELVNLDIDTNDVMVSDPITEDEFLYGTEEEIKELKEERAREKEEAENNKEYSGMALSHEYENYIVEKAEEYNIPGEVMLCLGNVETGGTWDCTGVVSNGNYGNFQINSCNIRQIHDHFGWYATVEETRDALKNDAEKNAEAAIWLVSRILECNHCQSFQTLCMSYNGSPNRVNYAYACAGIMNEYFPGKLEEVEEGIRNYEKPEEEKHKYNLEDSILAYGIDKKYVKKLV